MFIFISFTFDLILLLFHSRVKQGRFTGIKVIAYEWRSMKLFADNWANGMLQQEI